MARVVGRSKVKSRKARLPYGRIVWRAFVGLLAEGPKIALPQGPFVMLALCIAVYVFGLPHLRVTAKTNGHPYSPTYYRCEYFGVKSFVSNGPDCPVVLFEKYW